MTIRSVKWLMTLGAGALLRLGMGCVGGDDTAIVDGSADQTSPDSPTNGGYSLSVSAPSVVVEPGAMASVTVMVTRTGSFNDAINVSLTGAPPGVTGSGMIAAGQSSALLNVLAATTATVGQAATATVTGVSTPSNVTHTAPLVVRVGHLLLAANANTTWTVPSDVTTATVQAWGAGGGSGGGFATAMLDGGAGGAGGFEQADFVFTPGQVITVIVGTGGGGGTAVCCSQGCGCQDGAGAGGGGYSALVAQSDAGVDGGELLIVAGAGGGGQGTGTTPPGGYAGGAGGGATGVAGSGSVATNAGGPGTATAGGTSSVQAGSFLMGGAAASGSIGGPGGVPGGGAGNAGAMGGGGGGGGYFGGGAGNIQSTGGGGGGGSGFVLPSAMNVTSTAGMGTTPSATTTMYYGNNAAVGALGNMGVGLAGGPGRIVIFLP